MLNKKKITVRIFLALFIISLFSANIAIISDSILSSKVKAEFVPQERAKEADLQSFEETSMPKILQHVEAGAGSTLEIVPASAVDLANALDVTGLVSATTNGSDPAAVAISTDPLGVFPSPTGGSFVILSTGIASQADDDIFQSTVLNGLNNSNGQDLVQLEMILTPPAEATCLKMNVGFYSEEYPEWVNTIFNDAFIAEVMPSDINSSLQIVGNVIDSPYNFGYDPTGTPVSVNSPFGFTSSEPGVGFDGSSGLLETEGQIPDLGPDGNIKVVLSMTDMGDSIFDSAIFLDNFLWGYGQDCEEGTKKVVPSISIEVLDVEEKVCTWGEAVPQDGFLVTIEDWDTEEYKFEWRWIIPGTGVYSEWEELLPDSTWLSYEEIPFGDEDDYQYIFYHTEGSSVLDQIGDSKGDFQVRILDSEEEVVGEINQEFTFTDDFDHAACGGQPEPPVPPQINNVPNVVLYGAAPAFNNGKINVNAGATFKVVAYINKPGDPSYDYTFGGVCTGLIKNSNSFSFISQPLNLNAGTYSCYVIVTDSNGDKAKASVAIIVTSPAPVVLPEEKIEEEEAESKEVESPEVLSEFSCAETFKLSGYVYERKNENEKKDEDERGLADVVVKIFAYDKEGERILVVETETDEEGKWEVDLCNGSYEVELSVDTVEGDLILIGDEVRDVTISSEDVEQFNYEFEKETLSFRWHLCLIPLLILFLILILAIILSRKKKEEQEKIQC